MRSRHVVVGLLAVVLAVTAPAMAQGWHGRGGHGPRGAMGGGGMLLRMADKLNLTQDQRTQIKNIADQAKQAVQPFREQLKSEHQALMNSQQPGTFDEAAFRAQFEKDQPIRENIAVIEARARSQAFAVLNQQQRDQLKQMMTQWQQKHAGNGGTAPGAAE